MLRGILAPHGGGQADALLTALTAQLADKDARLADKDARLVDKDARLAEKDARLVDKDARLAEKDARLADKDARLVEKDARLAEKDALLAEKDARLVDKDARLADKDALLVAVAKDHARELAAAKHAADVATSRLNVRSILETSIHEAWALWPGSAGMVSMKSVSGRLSALLDERKGCTGLQAYVRIAAVDNGVPQDDAVIEARKLYTTFCSRAHADAPEASAGISSVVFDGSGRTALVAYAALVHFSGRRLSLYVADGSASALPLTMRTLRCCSATDADVLASSELVD